MRIAAAIVAVGGMVAAWGLWTALMGMPAADVDPGPPGGVVRDILPGGPAWTDGIREGQLVLELRAEDGAGDGLVRVSDGNVVRVFPMAAHVAALRDSQLVGFVAVTLAVLGFASLPRPRVAAGLGAMAAYVGAVPLVLAGNVVGSSVGAVVALVVIGAFVLLARREPVWLRAIGLGLFGLAGGWLATRFLAPVAFDLAEALRTTVTPLAATALIIGPLDLRTVSREVRATGFPTRLDALALMAMFVIAFVLLSTVGPVGLAVLILAVVLLYPRWRRSTSAGLDRYLFADLRERSGLIAIEEERARIARNLHDAPLQELAGVIKRLEGRDESDADVATLRTIATELRGIATDLQPAALEDLGLIPALEDLVGVEWPGRPIEFAVDDTTGYTARERPPADVELVVYRIAAECIHNAMTHSGAIRIDVAGSVRCDRISLTIRDDGTGFDPTDVRAAQRVGHFGLAVMRQRARMIGASVAVATYRGAGTEVSLCWPAA